MYALQRERIDLAPLNAGVSAPHLGARVLFEGIVRDADAQGTPIIALEYEAYEAAALAEFARIAERARERFGEVRIAIVHRVGEVPIGETAVVVLVAAPHRSAAFSACSYAIDELKAYAAIWKRERFADGSAQWVANDCTAP